MRVLVEPSKRSEAGILGRSARAIGCVRRFQQANRRHLIVFRLGRHIIDRLVQHGGELTGNRLLRAGGEMYFADIYVDRRIPDDLRRDPVLYGECLAGDIAGIVTGEIQHSFGNIVSGTNAA